MQISGGTPRFCQVCLEDIKRLSVIETEQGQGYVEKSSSR